MRETTMRTEGEETMTELGESCTATSIAGADLGCAKHDACVEDTETVIVGHVELSDVEDAKPDAVPEQLDAKTLAAALVGKLDQNPALHIPAFHMLDACAHGRCEMGDLYQQVTEELEDRDALPVQPMSAIADMLVRARGVCKSIEVDGIPYARSESELAHDGSIAENAKVLEYLEVTEVGRIVLASCSPRRRTANLFEDMPQFREALLRTLELCDTQTGLTTSELQEGLDADGYLYRDSRDLPTVYPSMYANFLKDAEALSWNHAWITTPLGHDIVKGQARR